MLVIRFRTAASAFAPLRLKYPAIPHIQRSSWERRQPSEVARVCPQPGVAGTKTLECRGKRLHVTRIFDSTRARSNAHFPLTPTLSLGERENHSPSFDKPRPSQSPNACARALDRKSVV